MKKEIKRIGLLSIAKLYGAMYGLFGLLFGIFFALLSTVGMIGANDESMFPLAGMGLLSVILMPLIYGAVGAVLGVIGALFYNLFAKWVGGIEIELRDIGSVTGSQTRNLE